jgi:putative transposase
MVPELAATLTPSGPDQFWAADLTYLRAAGEFLYLAVLLDAWSRKVIGYAFGPVLDTRLPLAALDAALTAAIRRRGASITPTAELNTPAAATESGSHRPAFRAPCLGREKPYDNAMAESFMKTLKHEEVYLRPYRTMADAIAHLPHYLEELYNPRRPHSSLGYRPPEEFEAAHQTTAA